MNFDDDFLLRVREREERGERRKRERGERRERIEREREEREREPIKIFLRNFAALLLKSITFLMASLTFYFVLD